MKRFSFGEKLIALQHYMLRAREEGKDWPHAGGRTWHQGSGGRLASDEQLMAAYCTYEEHAASGQRSLQTKMMGTTVGVGSSFVEERAACRALTLWALQ